VSKPATLWFWRGAGPAMKTALTVARVTQVRSFDREPRRRGSRIRGLELWADFPSRSRGACLSIAIGDNRSHSACYRTSQACECHWAVVRSSAAVAPFSRWRAGTMVLACAVVNAKALVGRFVSLGIGASVEAEPVIARQSHVRLGGGGASHGTPAEIGFEARLAPRIHIGCETVLGAGAPASLIGPTATTRSPCRPSSIA